MMLWTATPDISSSSKDINITTRVSRLFLRLPFTYVCCENCMAGFSAFVLNLSKSGNILFRSMSNGNCLFSPASLSMSIIVNHLSIILPHSQYIYCKYIIEESGEIHCFKAFYKLFLSDIKVKILITFQMFLYQQKLSFYAASGWFFGQNSQNVVNFV